MEFVPERAEEYVHERDKEQIQPWLGYMSAEEFSKFLRGERAFHLVPTFDGRIVKMWFESED